MDVATLRLNVVCERSSVSMIVASIDIRFLTAIRPVPDIKLLPVGATNGRHTALDPSSARGGVTNGTPSEVIGALEEVAACCVTDLGAYAGAKRVTVQLRA